MMSPVTRIAHILSLVVLFWTATNSASAEQSSAEQNRKLAGTIHRYFASMSGFREGNLIYRSQVEDLQRYLRKTQGNIPASDRRLSNRLLADRAPLVRLFYAESGEAVLSAAAGKLAGYAELGKAARTPAGRKLIKTAILSDRSDALVKFIKQKLAAKSSPDSQQASRTLDTRIYTVEQFIEAAIVTPSVGEKVVSNG